MMQKAFWAGHIAINSPSLLAKAVPVALAARKSDDRPRQKILVGTHHKALTVFMARIFRTFATITRRSWDVGSARLEYSRDVLIDHHSMFKFEFIEPGFVGLHIVRDPRDVLVSSMFYNRKSDETWLHWPVERFGWLSYQQKLNSLPSDEDRLLFEIEGETGKGIRQMLDWDYERSGFTELHYDDLVGEDATRNFSCAIEGWKLTREEQELLVALFQYFSLDGPGKKSKHIRNATSGQWRDHFTPRVEQAFNTAFPKAAEKLGFA